MGVLSVVGTIMGVKKTCSSPPTDELDSGYSPSSALEGAAREHASMSAQSTAHSWFKGTTRGSGNGADHKPGSSCWNASSILCSRTDSEISSPVSSSHTLMSTVCPDGWTSIKGEMIVGRLSTGINIPNVD